MSHPIFPTLQTFSSPPSSLQEVLRFLSKMCSCINNAAVSPTSRLWPPGTAVTRLGEPVCMWHSRTIISALPSPTTVICTGPMLGLSAETCQSQISLHLSLMCLQSSWGHVCQVPRVCGNRGDFRGSRRVGTEMVEGKARKLLAWMERKILEKGPG